MMTPHRRAPFLISQKLRTTTSFHEKHLKLTFMRSLALSLGLCMIFFLLPTVYFIESNYALFGQLAAQTRPGMVFYLERELYLIRAVLLISSSVFIGVCLLLVSRFIKNPSLESALSSSIKTETFAESSEADSSRRVA